MEVADGIATVILDSPEVKNALAPDMARQVVEICDAIDHDMSIGAAIITGANGTFCSGADTRILLSSTDAARNRSPLEIGGYDAFVRFGNLSVPTIAAVQGAAVGAGLNLALS